MSIRRGQMMKKILRLDFFKLTKTIFLSTSCFRENSHFICPIKCFLFYENNYLTKENPPHLSKEGKGNKALCINKYK